MGVTQPRRWKAWGQRSSSEGSPQPVPPIPFPGGTDPGSAPAPRRLGHGVTASPHPARHSLAFHCAAIQAVPGRAGPRRWVPAPAAAAGGLAAGRLLSARMVHHSGSIQCFRQQKGQYERRYAYGGHWEAAPLRPLCGRTRRGHSGLAAVSVRDRPVRAGCVLSVLHPCRGCSHAVFCSAGALMLKDALLGVK